MFEKVRTLLAEQLELDENEIQLDSSFVEDLGADSLDVVEMLMILEEEFDVTVPDEDAEKFQTVKDVVDFLKESV
ncbi:MAG: acyl carrier protein [Clostridia bacterium]|nr:acyl carrier protein [Clostridia bacterium]